MFFTNPPNALQVGLQIRNNNSYACAYAFGPTCQDKENRAKRRKGFRESSLCNLAELTQRCKLPGLSSVCEKSSVCTTFYWLTRFVSINYGNLKSNVSLVTSTRSSAILQACKLWLCIIAGMRYLQKLHLMWLKQYNLCRHAANLIFASHFNLHAHSIAVTVV